MFHFYTISQFSLVYFEMFFLERFLRFVTFLMTPRSQAVWISCQNVPLRRRMLCSRKSQSKVLVPDGASGRLILIRTLPGLHYLLQVLNFGWGCSRLSRHSMINTPSFLSHTLLPLLLQSAVFDVLLESAAHNEIPFISCI